MMKKIKTALGLVTMIIFILSAAAAAFAADRGTINEFISDARWKDGASYGTSPARAPYLYSSGYQCGGCRAYAYDFIAYVYGRFGNPATTGTSYGSNSSEIRRGDVIFMPSNGNYSDHWFVVLERNGNTLTTAEAASNKAQIATNHYSISGNYIYVSYATAGNKGNRSFTGYHYGDVPSDKFFDFWGFDVGTVTGTTQIWWKETGYGNCDVNLDINGTALETIYPDSGGYFSYQFDSTQFSNGTYTFGAIIRSTDGSEKYVTRTININNDTEKPVISNIGVTNITNDGYTVWCDITDNNKIGLVDFPTWTENNGQDDLKSHIYSENVNANSVRAWYRIKISEHNNEYGKYMTHIYAYDQNGNCSSVSISDWVDVRQVYDYVPADIFEYNGNIYARYDDAMSFASMSALCEQAGGHIVTINDQTENDEIAKHIDSGYYYIGYNDHTGGWQYGNSSYRNWGAGEPDNGGGIENCTAITSSGLWYDTKDEHYNYGILEQSGFILEIEGSSIQLYKTEHFENNKYEFFNTNMPYSVAKFYVKSKGGDIPTIESEEENTFINKNQNGWYSWIDLKKDGNGESFTWANGSSLGYVNWNDNEPDNNQGIERNVVMASNNGKWNDTSDKFNGGLIIEYDNYYGDINLDGQIDDADAKLLLRHISGISKLDADRLARADVNNDGNIDLLDVIAIKS